MFMVSAFLLVGGDMAAPWYLIYLWVTFGNGFRYGTRFLVSSAVLGAAGFALVIYITPVWREIPMSPMACWRRWWCCRPMSSA